MEYNVGDIVRTKKQHPCGSKIWEITRVGVDFKLKCKGCEHTVVLPRENISNICDFISSAIPGPLSSTLICALPSVLNPRIHMVEPCGVYFIALSIKLTRT